jgi:hypothetical protein
MADRLDGILAAQDRTKEVLARRAGRPAEPEYDPYQPRPFQYTEEQRKEIATFGRTLLCRECRDPHAWWETDDGTPTCSRCGAQDASLPSDACEKRFFSDDEKQARDAKKRNEEYKDEENNHLSKIGALEIPGNCAQADLWSANNRLNQCVVWLEMLLRDQSHGGFRISHSEVRTARILLRAVCVQWAKEGFADENFGNPVLWAIGAALQMVAMRPGGFAMPTPELCARVTLQGLHTWLRRYRSDAVFMAYESTLSMTKAKGADARLGQLASEHRVQRHAAFHELGNTPHKRYQKMLVLHKLIASSKFWDGAGLDKRVLTGKRPALMEHEGESKLRVWAMHRKVVGVDVARAHRSDTDTDAESSYPASPAREGEDDDAAGADGDVADTEQSEFDIEAPSKRPWSEPAPAPAPAPVAEMPHAAENRAIPPGGQSNLLHIDQQLADPFGHLALAAGFSGDGDADRNAAGACEPEGEGEGGADCASDALPSDIDLPDDVWEERIDDRRAAIEAEEEEREAQVQAQEIIEANAFAAAEWCLLDFSGPPEPPKIAPAVKRKPIPLRDLKLATQREVLACSQYWQKDGAKSKAFYERWKEESKAHREVVRSALEAKQRKDKAFAEARAAREAKAKALAERKARAEEEKREARGWNQFLGQAVKKEQAEERLARGRGGVCYVTPTEELIDRQAGTIAPIRVTQLLPTIRISSAAIKKADAKIAPEELRVVRVRLAGTAYPLRSAPPAKRAAPSQEGEAPAEGDPYARHFKARRRPDT